MLKLKLQYFGHLIRKTDSIERLLCWERLKEGGEGGNRGWDGWRASHGAWVWVSSRSWWWTGKPGVLHAVHGVTQSQTRMSYWTEPWGSCCFSGSPEGLVWDRFLSTLDSDKMWGSLPWLPWNRAAELSESRIIQLHSCISSHRAPHNMSHLFPFISG